MHGVTMKHILVHFLFLQVITGLVSVFFLVIHLNSALFVLTLGFEVMFEASVRISCSVFTLVLVKEKSVYEVTLELYEEQSSVWL